MTWERKLKALKALAEISLKMRDPGDWYVNHNIEVKSGAFLCGRYGNGSTPQEAVEDHWNKLTKDLTEGEYIVVGGTTNRRRAYKWDGFIWEDVVERRDEHESRIK